VSALPSLVAASTSGVGSTDPDEAKLSSLAPPSSALSPDTSKSMSVSASSSSSSDSVAPVAAPPVGDDSDVDDSEDRPRMRGPVCRSTFVLRQDASTTRHLLTHLPFNEQCEVCRTAKGITQSMHRGGTSAVKQSASKFGDVIVCDHKIISTEWKNRGVPAVGFIAFDIATSCTYFCETRDKTALETEVALRDYLGHSEVLCVYSDRSNEIKAALTALKILHRRSLPHQPRTNAIVERRVRMINDGVRCLLFRSGLTSYYWAKAAAFFVGSFNCCAETKDGKSPYLLRHGEAAEGFKEIPFGSKCGVRLPTQLRKELYGTLSATTLPGIFLRYIFDSGGKFRGHVEVALESDVASSPEKVARVHIIHMKNVVLPDKVLFPFFQEIVKDGQLESSTLRLLNPEQKLRVFGGDDDSDEKRSDVVGSDDKGSSSSSPAAEVVSSPSSSSSLKPTNPLTTFTLDVDYWPQRRNTHRPAHIRPDLWRDASALARSEAVKEARQYGFYVEPPLSCPGAAHLSSSIPPLPSSSSSSSPLPSVSPSSSSSSLSSPVSSSSSSPLVSLPSSSSSSSAVPSAAYASSACPAVQSHSSSFSSPLHFVDSVASDDVFDRWNESCLDEERQMQGSALVASSVSCVPPVRNWETMTSKQRNLFRPAAVSYGMWRRLAPNHQRRLWETWRSYNADRAPSGNDEPTLTSAGLYASHSSSPSSSSSRRDSHCNDSSPLTPEELQFVHRVRESGSGPWGLVTKNLTKRDTEWGSAKVLKAVNDEMLRLESIRCWSPQPVELASAKRVANAKFTRAFMLRGLKNHEMAEEFQKAKGRLVAMGNNVTNVDGAAAFFNEKSGSPTSMPTIRSMLAWDLIAGHGGSELSDALQAYVQSMLPKDECVFIFIPRELWTPSMIKAAGDVKNPWWRLERPLYGLSCSGAIWSQHLSSILLRLGWKRIENFPETYYLRHEDGSLSVLSCYVDDLILSGAHKAKCWKAIRQNVVTSPPEKLSRILGLNVSQDDDERTLTLSMNEYITQSIEMYEAACGPLPKRRALSPGFNIPSNWASDEALSSPGKNGRHSASLLMKLLYCARLCRLDCQFAIVSLSRAITKWSALDDRRMEQLFMYMRDTRDRVLVYKTDSSVDPSTLSLVLYCDADHSGSHDTTKSHSGAVIRLESPCGRVSCTLDWGSKMQGATAHSSTEAEVISLSKGMRDLGCPFQELWSLLLGRDVTLQVREDSNPCIACVTSGFSSQLRSLAKHHRVSLAICNELCIRDGVQLTYISTKDQIADILTKILDGPAIDRLCRLSGLV
jgi:hypothetical protein